MKVTDAESWEAVEYEYMMYFRSKARKAERPADQVFKNAMVESQLVHARMLADFLIIEQKKQFGLDDVTLKDLIPAVRDEIRAEIDEFASKYGKQHDDGTLCWQLNKLIVHLTHHRAGSGNHNALFEALELALEPVLRLVAAKSQRAALILWSTPPVVALVNQPETNTTSGTSVSGPTIALLNGPNP